MGMIKLHRKKGLLTVAHVVSCVELTVDGVEFAVISINASDA